MAVIVFPAYVHTLLNAADNKPMDIPEAYEGYTAYTQEMVDKIDEIAKKYSLNLLGAFAPFQNWENHIFQEALGIGSLLIEESPAKIELGNGYFYESGNFNVSFHMTMPKENGQWPYEMLNEIYYSKADCFDEIYWAIGDLSKWEQWNYTTKNGDNLTEEEYHAVIASYKTIDVEMLPISQFPKN